MDKFDSRCSDGVFLGYALNSRGFHVWNLDTKQVVETCEVSFDKTMPCSTPLFELLGDDELGASIFEEEEDAPEDGDGGTTTCAAYPTPSETSDDDYIPPITSTTTIDVPSTLEGPAADAGEVTSRATGSRAVQRDHPSERIIGDIGSRTLRSQTGSVAFFAHFGFVASFEPKDVGHALSDSHWVNAMHEELENFERNQVWKLVEPPPQCNPIGTKWVFKNKQDADGVVVRNKARLVAQGFCQK